MAGDLFGRRGKRRPLPKTGAPIFTTEPVATAQGYFRKKTLFSVRRPVHARGFLNLGLFLLEKGSPLAKEVAEKISGHMHRVPRSTLLAKGNWMWNTKALLVALQRSPS